MSTFSIYLVPVQGLSLLFDWRRALSPENVFQASSSCVCLFDTEKREGACASFVLEKARICLPTRAPVGPENPTWSFCMEITHFFSSIAVFFSVWGNWSLRKPLSDIFGKREPTLLHLSGRNKTVQKPRGKKNVRFEPGGVLPEIHLGLQLVPCIHTGLKVEASKCELLFVLRMGGGGGGVEHKTNIPHFVRLVWTFATAPYRHQRLLLGNWTRVYARFLALLCARCNNLVPKYYSQSLHKCVH